MNLFLLFLSTFLLADLLVWVRGALALRRHRAALAWQIGFHLFVALQTASLAGIVLARMYELPLYDYMPGFWLICVYIWHLLIAPLALVANLLGIGSGMARWIWKRLGKPEAQPAPEPPPAAGTPQTRREFIATAAVLTPPLLTLGLGFWGKQQLGDVAVRHLTLTLPDLPPALDGMTIAHLSDTHVGRFTHGKVIQKMVETTNALKSDLVVFTGDLINDSLDWLPEAVEMLSAIDGPVVVCEGNHDLFEDAAKFRNTLKSSPGFTTLINEAETITLKGHPVQLLGLRWGGPPQLGRQRYSEEVMALTLEELLALRDPTAFQILLAHHPHAWDHAPQVPLTFAGHTHGGQFMVTGELGMGPAMFRYWSGLYERGEAGERQGLVVSNGSGNWFPLRIGAPAEIIHLTLRRAV